MPFGAILLKIKDFQLANQARYRVKGAYVRHFHFKPRQSFRIHIGWILLGLLALPSGCGPDAPPVAPRFVATIHPVAAILNEIAQPRATVHVLVSPGASTHAYDLRPSDVRVTQSALAVFYVNDHLDGWIAKTGSDRKIAVFDLIPEAHRLDGSGHRHSGDESSNDNPHFWSDPLAVREIVMPLAEALGNADPDGRDLYQENAQKFAFDLDTLHAEIAQMLQPVEGASLIAFHPSWSYFLNRYGIETAAVIEPFPGKEPTPKDIKKIIEVAARLNAKAIFTEPQLPRRPAEVIAEATGLSLYEIDPIGGVEGRMTYRELLLHNAQTISEALR